MVAPTPIVSPDDLADYLAGDQESRLAQVTAMLRAECGWHVAPVVEETITVQSDGGRLLLLPSLRVKDVQSVTVGGVEIDPDAYVWHENGVLVVHGTDVPCGKVEVKLEHGYEIEQVADFTGLVMAVTTSSLKNPDGRNPSSLSIGQARIGYAGEGGAPQRLILPRPQMAILDKYRLPSRP